MKPWLKRAMTVALGLCAIVVTPFAEEVFFCGFLFTWMATHRPFWLAIAASWMMFGAMHILPPQALSAALMVVALCAMYWPDRCGRRSCATRWEMQSALSRWCGPPDCRRDGGSRLRRWRDSCGFFNARRPNPLGPAPLDEGN